MNVSLQTTSVARPRWDGSRIMFEIADGDRHIPCAISRAALQDVCGRRSFRPSELLTSFANARPLIEKIARNKLRSRPGGVSGLLNIWADDIDDPPPASTPVAAHQRTAFVPR
ncbi:MAG TPA: DUF1488 family protein [Acetobacteraceae bacterium]|nr:DUF1488 family protein [Acetobacteraceae bacterium]